MTFYQNSPFSKFTFRNAREIVLENTKTTIESNKIERRLQTDLKKIIQELDSLYTIKKDISALRRIYASKVREIIRNAVEDTYTVAMAYVTKSFAVKSFSTETDLSNIRNITIQYENNFWNSYDRRQHKDDAVLSIELQDPRPDKNNISLAESIAIGVIAATVSMATTSKTRQLQEQNNNDSVLLSELELMLSDLDLSDLRLISILQELQRQKDNKRNNTKIQFMFRTARDDRVCFICFPLDGLKFNIDDPLLPILPRSTHINCRCRLLLVIDDVVQEG